MTQITSRAAAMAKLVSEQGDSPWPDEVPAMCRIRSTHVHEFHGMHADVSHLQGRPSKPDEIDREVPR